MTKPALRRIAASEFRAPERPAVPPDVLERARDLVESVRQGGWERVRELSERFGDATENDALIHDRAALQRALARLPTDDRAVLERTADRIRTFADAQCAAFTDVRVPLPGGAAGHTLRPVDAAGCYAPGGRYPLPSSVLMTAVTARAAGVDSVWVASPRPTEVTLAAAAIAGADGLLATGGVQAVAALAFGAGPLPRCDAVVGPGNVWVTGAKQHLAGEVRIDLLAGPSELVVVADRTADPDDVAADLLAQAEHDPLALPVLLALDERTADAVDASLARQLVQLRTADVARRALAGGFAVVIADPTEAADICNALAPEHLQLSVADPDSYRGLLRHYGALFSGVAGAEVLGDYGAGPNHTLPTGGTSRVTGGLSVMTFLRVQTWLHLDDPVAADRTIADAEHLARLEGLVGHARAAARRRVRR